MSDQAQIQSQLQTKINQKGFFGMALDKLEFIPSEGIENEVIMSHVANINYLALNYLSNIFSFFKEDELSQIMNQVWKHIEHQQEPEILL